MDISEQKKRSELEKKYNYIQQLYLFSGDILETIKAKKTPNNSGWRNQRVSSMWN